MGASGLTHAEGFTQDQPEVVCRNRHQVTFMNFSKPAKPTAAGSASFADVGKTPFDTFATQFL